MSQTVWEQTDRFKVHSKDQVDGTVYYKDLRTGKIVYIGRDGEVRPA